MTFKTIYEYYEHMGATDKKEKQDKKSFLKFKVASNLNKKIQVAYNKGYDKKSKGK